MSLVGGKGYSPSMRKRLDRIAMYVMRAFSTAAPDAGALAKAAAKGRECVALGLEGEAPAADKAALEQVQGLLEALQIEIDRAGAVEATASAAAPMTRHASSPKDVEAPVESLTSPLARTMPLPVNLFHESLRLPPVASPASSPAQPPARPVPTENRPRSAVPPADRERRNRRIKKPSAPDPRVVAATRELMSSLLGRRTALLRNPLARWGDFRTLDRQISRTLQAAGWMKGEKTHDTNGDDDVAGAVIAVHQAGDQIDAAWPGTTVTELIPARAEGILLAYRFSNAPSLVPAVQALRKHHETFVRLSALTALAGQGLVPVDELVGLLNDPDPQTVATAADLLAWLGRPDSDAGAVELRLRGETSAPLRCALLFAASAMGSLRALEETRRIVDDHLPVTSKAVDTLAVAGDPRDIARLLNLAHSEPDKADIALLAAAHLGNPDALASIKDAEIDSPVGQHVAELIFGSGGAPTNIQSGSRLLSGEAWSISSVHRRLAAADEFVRRRPWLALESCVRAAVRPAGVLALDDYCPNQDRLTEQLAAGSRRSASIGGWYFAGRSTRDIC